MIQLDMLDIAKQIKGGLSGGNILAFRSIGTEARKIVEDKIAASSDNTTFILDFKNIQLSDTSFLDETVVEITYRCQQHKYGERLIAVRNLSDVIRDNLHSAILLRMDKQNQKVPVAEISSNGNLTIISQFEDSMKALLAKIHEKNGKITAVELAELEGIELNTAATRLKRLYDYGFLFRQNEQVGNRKHFVYQSIGI